MLTNEDPVELIGSIVRTLSPGDCKLVHILMKLVDENYLPSSHLPIATPLLANLLLAIPDSSDIMLFNLLEAFGTEAITTAHKYSEYTKRKNRENLIKAEKLAEYPVVEIEAPEIEVELTENDEKVISQAAFIPSLIKKPHKDSSVITILPNAIPIPNKITRPPPRKGQEPKTETSPKKNDNVFELEFPDNKLSSESLSLDTLAIQSIAESIGGKTSNADTLPTLIHMAMRGQIQLPSTTVTTSKSGARVLSSSSTIPNLLSSSSLQSSLPVSLPTSIPTSSIPSLNALSSIASTETIEPAAKNPTITAPPARKITAPPLPIRRDKPIMPRSDAKSPTLQ